MADRGAIRSEIWYAGVPVEHIYHDFDLMVLKVIWGSFGPFSSTQHLNFTCAIITAVVRHSAKVHD